MELTSAKPTRQGRLTVAELDALSAYAARATWPAGFTIYQRGAPADGVFVVLRGRVVLRSRVKAGRGFIPAIAGPGETFGGEGLGAGGTCATDARAEEECETLHLSAERFRALTRERPPHALALMGQVMHQHGVLLERLRELATLSVEQRLVTTLLRLREQGALGEADGRTILDGPQYRLLCEMVGATRESVSIVVNRLIGDGLARRHGAGFLVPSLPDLVTRAGASMRGDIVMPIGVETDADGRLRA
jgi:CRP/FNR family transcriptional regulator, cyclic AMP receptor protein